MWELTQKTWKSIQLVLIFSFIHANIYLSPTVCQAVLYAGDKTVSESEETKSQRCCHSHIASEQQRQGPEMKSIIKTSSLSTTSCLTVHSRGKGMDQITSNNPSNHYLKWKKERKGKKEKLFRVLITFLRSNNSEQLRLAWPTLPPGLGSTTCPWHLVMRIWSLIKLCQEVFFGRGLKCCSLEFAERCPSDMSKTLPLCSLQPLALV